MTDCLPKDNQRWPTMAESVEIVSSQMTRLGQMRQLQFMRETQGEAFAQQVKAKVVQAGKARTK